jgi:protein required for attachment to host cells
MTNIVRIPHDHAILVCDSHKALILVNDGAVAQPELIVETHFEIEEDEMVSVQTDRPGRRFDGNAAATMHGQRSAMEMPDLARRQAEGFADRLLKYLTHRQSRDPFRGVVLVAPPAFLGILRDRMDDDLGRIVVEEIAKDLVEMPLPKLQKVLLGSLSA